MKALASAHKKTSNIRQVAELQTTDTCPPAVLASSDLVEAISPLT
jgi:hypothetical protein